MKKVLSRFMYMGMGVFILLLGACASDDGGEVETGSVQLSITDAADHAFSEVVVSIKEVRAVPAGKEDSDVDGLPLIVVFETPRVVNVLDLAFQQELLGEALVPAGDYNQLRLVLEENTDPLAPVNYIILADDPEQTPIPLDTPSGHESGLKIAGHFEVGAGEITSVALDFDPSRAIVQSGQSQQWQFKPTGIRVVQTEELLLSYGAVAGQVAYEVTEGGVTTLAPVSAAMVHAIPQGGVAPVASSSVNPEDGTFRLLLPDGIYELQVIAEGFADYSSAPVVFDVIEGVDTDAGTLLLSSVSAF